MFYRKVKKFCFDVDFFIWIIIKNNWCDIKNVKSWNIFDLMGKKTIMDNWQWLDWLCDFRRPLNLVKILKVTPMGKIE